MDGLECVFAEAAIWLDIALPLIERVDLALVELDRVAVSA